MWAVTSSTQVAQGYVQLGIGQLQDGLYPLDLPFGGASMVKASPLCVQDVTSPTASAGRDIKVINKAHSSLWPCKLFWRMSEPRSSCCLSWLHQLITRYSRGSCSPSCFWEMMLNPPGDAVVKAELYLPWQINCSIAPGVTGLIF